MNQGPRDETVIRTPDRRLRVFVSSTLGELAEERRAVSRAISALRLTPVMFELGARPYPPRAVYQQYLAQSERGVAGLFNLGYEVLLHVLTRFFTHTDETDEQLDTLVGAAFGIMTGVLKPLGTALTRLPFGPGSPDHTAGAAFQMYYQIGNFVPWRDAAWVLLSERAATLSAQCAETARHAGVPGAVSSAAAAAAGIALQIAGYVPDNLRPA